MFTPNRMVVSLALLILLLLPVACIGPQPAAEVEAPAATPAVVAVADADSGLVGPTWQLTRMATRDGAVLKPADSTLYTLTFGEDGSVAAQILCNSAGGSYTTDGDSLSLGALASTMMACPPDAILDHFVDGLGNATTYSVEGNTLKIVARAGTMTFTAAGSDDAEEAPSPEATATPSEEGAEQAAVTGNVTYMVRMALPEGAVVTVRLVDISLADAPAELLAEQTITTTGEQVPFAFELAYDPTQIQESNRYAVQAFIEADGQLLFISDTVVPVLTMGAPAANVEVVVVPVSSPVTPTEGEVPAEGETPAEGEAPTEGETPAEGETPTEAATTSLTGVVWQWQRTQMNDDSTTTPSTPGNYALEFNADGTVALQADCNGGSGPYTVEGNRLTFGAIATTLMACPEGSQADAYLQQLSQVGSYFITEDSNLVLELQVDSGSMIFAAAQ